MKTKNQLLKDLNRIKDRGIKLKEDRKNLKSLLAALIKNIDLLTESDIQILKKCFRNTKFLYK